jgi:hypothetical protein
VSALSGRSADRTESWLALKLARAMDAARRGGHGEVARVWDEEWQAVYRLADVICERHLASAGAGGGFPEPIVARL